MNQNSLSANSSSSLCKNSNLFSQKWLLLLLILFAGCKKVTEDPGLIGVCPIVVSTNPAPGATGVARTTTITATFNEVMDASTVIPAFTVMQGTTVVPGIVTYSGMTATFTPANLLTYNTPYTATIAAGVKDPAGNAMIDDYIWSFTTASDIIGPMVILTDPLNGASGVALNKTITAIFSEAMKSSTIDETTFLLTQGATEIPGTVSYAGVMAMFDPAADLLPGLTYTATLKMDIQDSSGNALAADYEWSFTTVATDLGALSIFGVFGGTAGVTNEGLNTVINGSLGSTGASTLVTGFHDVTASYTETPLNVGNVTGGIFTAPPPPGTAASFLIATNGLLAANILYNNTSPASEPGGTDPGAGELGGLTLPPGVYQSASGTFMITTGNLTLDGMGDPNAEWIFQTAAGLTVGIAGPIGARSVMLINRASANNVYWHVGSAATINAAGGGVMSGNIIASAGVTFSTAGNEVQTVLNGRAISLNASVTMVNTTINVP